MSKQTDRLNVDRREALQFVGGGVVAALLAGTLATEAKADMKLVNKAINRLVGDGAMKEGRIKLDLPDIAENGRTVPVGVTVESPMTDGDHVKSLHLFAEKNPAADVASIHFSPAMGEAKAALRMRLGGTQNVIAVAEMSDGSLYTSKQQVKVTIGGCGG
ncbi:MAG: thiosulfate oxidation carrier protein SoxY [Pseudomonadota bacterium]